MTDASQTELDPPSDIVLRVRAAEGEDVLEHFGDLVGEPRHEDDCITGRFVPPLGLIEAVTAARKNGHLPDGGLDGARADLWHGIDPRRHVGDESPIRRALGVALSSTQPYSGPRRRVVVSAPQATLVAHLPFEGLEAYGTRPFETGRAELLRYVNVPNAPPRTPYAPYLRGYRALVLVGDIEQGARTSGSVRDVVAEVQAVVDNLRHAGAEVLVGSVTGRLDLKGAVQRPLLLDDRGDDAEREARLRKALRYMLGAAPIDVLHYIGHGEEETETVVGCASQRISFSLPSRPHDGGRPQRVWIHGTDLANWTRRPIRLCAVSACAAAPQLAESLCLAAEHVPNGVARLVFVLLRNLESSPTRLRKLFDATDRCAFIEELPDLPRGRPIERFGESVQSLRSRLSELVGVEEFEAEVEELESLED